MSSRRAEIVAAVATAPAAWWWFARRPPAHVLAGTRALDAFVPAHYQASAFPAFAAFGVALALDLLERRERASWVARSALLGATSLVAVVRLGGAIPLSGHAVLFAALLGYALAPQRPEGAVIAAAAAVPGLALTSYYKLFVWNDGAWFAASLAAGTTIGLACASAAARDRT